MTVRTVTLADGSELSCYTVLFAAAWRSGIWMSGSVATRRCGVYYGAALTEAATYRGRTFCGWRCESAVKRHVLLQVCRKVTLLVRGPNLDSMSQYLINRIEETPHRGPHPDSGEGGFGKRQAGSRNAGDLASVRHAKSRRRDFISSGKRADADPG